MIGPVTRWRNRRAAKATLNDPEFMATVAQADADCAADLAELEAAGADESFGTWLGTWLASQPDPDTDMVEAPEI